MSMNMQPETVIIWLSLLVGVLLLTVAVLAVCMLKWQRQNRSLGAESHDWRRVADNLPDAVMRFGPDGRCRYASPKLFELLGEPVREVVGERVEQVGIGPYLNVEQRQALAVIQQTGQPLELEVTVPLADGAHMVRVRCEPEAGPEQAAGVVWVLQDITALRRMEESIARCQPAVGAGARDGQTVFLGV